jgi:hydroxypyruvate isomerase
MPRFAANLSMMFGEIGFLARFAAAAKSGFDGVEYQFPYEFPPEVIAKASREQNLTNVLFNLPPGDWNAGERGIACVPGREGEFRSGVAKAIEYAKQLDTKLLHAMAGVKPVGGDVSVVRATYVENIRYAAKEMHKHGITLLIEAINTRDIPGFFVNTQQEAFGLLLEVGAENVKLQMDLYHMQIAEGDLAMTLSKYAAYCGHVQIAGVPKRNEPSGGEVNYPYLFDHLDQMGYGGWVGCEYRPVGNTEDGLNWFRPTRS